MAVLEQLDDGGRARALPRFSSDTRWLAAGALAVCVLVLLPIVSLIWIGATSGTDSMGRIARYVLPQAAWTTALLMAGVAALTAVIGTVSAWLVTFYRFPGRRVFAWALALPLAVPTYLAAYAFVEFATFTGPLQGAYRAIFGFRTLQDYWFPEVRSLPGAVVVLSLVLYPYVFLSTRALFVLQGRRLVDAAGTLGAGHARIFFTVLAPLARPAVALGVTLALMETLNDIGAVEFLGVPTLTFSVYSLWLNQGDLGGAAQLAIALFLVVLLLIVVERRARRNRHYAETRQGPARHTRPAYPLTGWRAGLAFLACLAPPALGFGVPFYILGGYALKRLDTIGDPKLIEALGTSILLAGGAALLTVAAGLLLAYWGRLSRSRLAKAAIRVATVGYAVPGTIIALGMLIPLAALDNRIDALSRWLTGGGTGLLITGSGALLLYAYAVRFLAMAEGTVDGGLKKLSPSLDMAARTLGCNATRTAGKVLLPLAAPALMTAGLLVFIDCLKELSATILLRPFGLHTLSTYIYEFASMARQNEAGIAALFIVVTGMVPAFLLSRLMLPRERG
ncbi:MAG: ABC transporter permease [Flavobacteriaceae bacterium]